MVLGIIKMSIGNGNQHVFLNLHVSLVSNAATFWRPYLLKDIESIEKVQRRASGLALKQKPAET